MLDAMEDKSNLEQRDQSRWFIPTDLKPIYKVIGNNMVVWIQGETNGTLVLILVSKDPHIHLSPDVKKNDCTL